MLIWRLYWEASEGTFSKGEQEEAVLYSAQADLTFRQQYAFFISLPAACTNSCLVHIFFLHNVVPENCLPVKKGFQERLIVNLPRRQKYNWRLSKRRSAHTKLKAVSWGVGVGVGEGEGWVTIIKH